MFVLSSRQLLVFGFHPVHDLGLNQNFGFGKLLQDGRLIIHVETFAAYSVKNSREGISGPVPEENQIAGLLSGGVLLEGGVYTVHSGDLLKGPDGLSVICWRHRHSDR